MEKMLNRVPEITIYFWIIKVLATTVGETGADFFAFTMNLGLGVTSYIMGGLLLIALFNQFRIKRYVPLSYWLVVVLISIVGTLITDRLVDDFGVSLITTTIVFSLVLLAVFGFWYLSEKTLAMHSINTTKRELFYWVAILFTFALGTSAGDFLGESLRLGYANSALLFGAAIAIITVGYYYFKMNAILAFWLAYILTRPLGASIGDLLSQPVKNGGFGYGTVGTSMLFLSIIFSLVIYLSFKSKKRILLPSNEEDWERQLNKVAAVTIFFWIMKILATTLGETAGDFISMSLNLGYYVGFAVTFVILTVLLFIQIKADRHRPVLYWTAIIATTTAGTEVSDLMDRSLGLGYTAGSLILVAGLLTVLAIWYYRDRDLSVYPIVRQDAETTYWVAIVFSNSLGTAFGDFLTSNMGLSYVQGAFVTAGVIGVVIALHYHTKLSEVLLFWIAFIFTRPFGATFGDFLTKPVDHGGLALPRGYASIITLFLLAFVLVFSMRRKKTRAS
ncbi:hypothetical protein [Crocosphaera sp. UHCC 0190]|uniref:COG4705 family protein n=1 Tax=Crocosphaera sp. UHCC 0190 TaxID=3110246 RepID=UPI002B1FA00F|nr:hypothetical protein [Crocosphaera sp. UHCC 0190]